MTAPALQLRGLARRYGDMPVFTGVDLDLAPGEFVALLGESGVGKSTLLNIIAGLDEADAGQVLLTGQDVRALAEPGRARLRRERLGFVFQAFHLLPHRSVLQNVMLAMLYSGVPRAEREKRARTALERVGLGHRINFNPITLSGGERQRVAVARAVVGEPRLLLADEPTGNLDATTSGEVMDLFEELNADGLTLVIITHDKAVSARARRRIRIADGTLAEIA